MIRRERILASTALAILMTATGGLAQAAPQVAPDAQQPVQAAPANAPVVLAQAQDDDQDRKERKKRGGKEEKSGQRAQEAKPERKAAEPKAEQAAKPEPKKAQPKEEQAAKPEPKKAPEPKAEQAAKPEPKKAAEPKAEQAAKPEPKKQEPKAEAAKPEPKQLQRKQQQAEKPEPKAEEAQRKSLQKTDEAKPASKAAGEKSDDQKAGERKAVGEKAGDDRRDASQDRRDAGSRDRDRNGDDGQRRAGDNDRDKAGMRDGGTDRDGNDRRNAGDRRDDSERKGDTARRDGRPQNAAPMLDSQKDAEHNRGGERRDGNQRRDADRNRDRDGQRQRAEGPRPDSDRAAQRDIKVNIEEVRKLDNQKGRRINEREWRDFRRPDGAEVVRREGDRTLIQLNNQIIVRDNRHDRISRHAKDVYYEELPDQLRREVVIRPDGSKIITVRNGYGDIVRRTRVVGSQEYVLVYAGDERHDRFYDPAQDLPPLQIDIPQEEYILESDTVQDPDRYYDFFEQPPVEPVQQLYTIDQVKYSSRVRDMVRRVDLDTINFATGSAEISQDELPALEAVADAMQRTIEKNPAETFLIEGHTDAVGSDDSNLVLSDERAEAVATALTDVYKIPPENLFTQGYGEQYLKIDTDSAERENRRVAIRRITPLVSPVASNEK